MIQDLRFKVQYIIANVIEGKNKASEYTVFQNSTSMWCRQFETDLEDKFFGKSAYKIHRY